MATFILSSDELVALAELAIANPCRSERQQEALIRVTRRMDPEGEPFVHWSAQAQTTHDWKPCRECERPLPQDHHRDICDECRGLPQEPRCTNLEEVGR